MEELNEIIQYQTLLREATASVERELALEDIGWLMSGQNANLLSGGLTETQRRVKVAESRKYFTLDPLGARAVGIWTSYSFGQGITIRSKDETVQAVIDKFWNSPANRKILSATGQIKSSNKLLVDGEVFFALFLGTGGDVTIRWVDPFEMTEFITAPGDIEDVMYYKRVWSNIAGSNNSFYRSTTNIDGKPAPYAMGVIDKTEDALIYFLPFNTIAQRGNPLLMPALDWIKQYRKYMASRIAIMLALARFAWKAKVKGGQVVADSVKGNFDGEYPQAGSTEVENDGMDLTPIKTDSGAKNAEKDGRMIKLQVCAAAGIPYQYFGDIEAGNYATAKTVELPMLKQFQMYQQMWEDAYRDILQVVFDANNIPPDKRELDIDFPIITPKDATAAADAMAKIIAIFPELAESDEVLQTALQTMGVSDIPSVMANLKDIKGAAKDLGEGSVVNLIKALQEFKESMKSNEEGE